MNPPWCSGWQCQPAIQPDNVYGDEAPVDILRHYDAFDITGPRADLSPDHPEGSSNDEGPSALGPTGSSIAANISWDGGAKLIYYLLSVAIQPLDGAGGDLPNVGNVREWHYKDLAHVPEAAQKEWKAACYEELESLDKCEVFDVEIAGIWRWERLSFYHLYQLHGSGVVLITVHLLLLVSLWLLRDFRCIQSTEVYWGRRVLLIYLLHVAVHYYK